MMRHAAPTFEPVEMKKRAEAAQEFDRNSPTFSCSTLFGPITKPVALPSSEVLALLAAYDEQVERVKELEAALRTFVAGHEKIPVYADDGSRSSLWLKPGRNRAVTTGDIRRAAALLATPTHNAGQEGEKA